MKDKDFSSTKNVSCETSKKKVFVSIKKIMSELPRDLRVKFLMLVGKRTNGKSWTAKQLVIEKFMTSGEKFVLLRRTEEDFKKDSATKYWRDVVEEGKVKEWTNGKYEVIFGYGSNIYMGNYTEKGGMTREVQIGDYYALSTYVKTKSIAFPKSYTTILFEEFVDDTGYLHDEPRKFLHMISTIFRERNGLVIMIGNSIDVNCVYFDEWGIDAVGQPDDTTEIYSYEEIDDGGNPYTVTIACNVAKIQDGGGSHMMFGDAKAQISGQWTSKRYTHPKKKDKYRLLYQIAVVNKTRYIFIINLVRDKKGLAVRVYQTKKDTDYKDLGIKRIIFTNTMPVIDTDPLHTSGFIKRIPAEQKIIELLKDPIKVGYVTNLCGASFNNIIKESRLLGWR